MLEATRVRNQVMELLKGKTSAGNNVYDSRVSPHGKNKLPALNIYTLAQNGNSKTGGSAPQFDTTLTLTIEGAVSYADGWGAKSDLLREQVEGLLLHNPDFVKEFEDIAFYNVTTRQEDGGEAPVVKFVMSLGLKYVEEFQPIIEDELRSVRINLDAIEPADTSTHPHGGPDGRYEGVLRLKNMNTTPAIDTDAEPETNTDGD